MSNIDKRALREAAEKATPGVWVYLPKNTSIEYDYGSDDSQGSITYMDSGDFTQRQTDLNGAFIAAANPTTVLALLDELEAKDNRINRLEAIVAIAEQRNGLMREWKRALKVPCDLFDDQVPVVVHGMVIRLERLKETESKLEAAEKRIAELETDCWTYENTVKNLLERAGSAESACLEAARILKSGERMALNRAVNILLAVGEDATHYQYPVMLPEPLGWKSPSGNEVLKRKDVIAALMSAGVPVQGED